ncbi:hypothetical protein HDU99_004159, partial [Rhizoclosmatium hyalinum]
MLVKLELFGAAGIHIIKVNAYGKYAKDFFKQQQFPVVDMYDSDEAKSKKLKSSNPRKSSCLPSVAVVYGYDHTAAMKYKPNFQKGLSSSPMLKQVREYLDFLVNAHLNSAFLASLQLSPSQKASLLPKVYEYFANAVAGSDSRFWCVDASYDVMSKSKCTPSVARNLFYGDSAGIANINPKFVNQKDQQNVICGDVYQYFSDWLRGQPQEPVQKVSLAFLNWFAYFFTQPKAVPINSEALLRIKEQIVTQEQFELATLYRMAFGVIGGYLADALHTFTTRGVSNMSKMRSGKDTDTLLKSIEATCRINKQPNQILIRMSLLFQCCHSSKLHPFQDFCNFVQDNVNTVEDIYVRDIVELEAVAYVTEDEIKSQKFLESMTVVASRMNRWSVFTVKPTDDGIGRGLGIQHVLGLDAANSVVVFYFEPTGERQMCQVVISPGDEKMTELRQLAQSLPKCLKDHIQALPQSVVSLPFQALTSQTISFNSILIPTCQSVYNLFYSPQVLVGQILDLVVDKAEIDGLEISVSLRLGLLSAKVVYGMFNKELDRSKTLSTSSVTMQLGLISIFRQFTPANLSTLDPCRTPGRNLNKTDCLYVIIDLVSSNTLFDCIMLSGSVDLSLGIVANKETLSHYQQHSKGQALIRTVQIKMSKENSSFEVHPCRRFQLLSQNHLKTNPQQPVVSTALPPVIKGTASAAPQYYASPNPFSSLSSWESGIDDEEPLISVKESDSRENDNDQCIHQTPREEMKAFADIFDETVDSIAKQKQDCKRVYAAKKVIDGIDIPVATYASGTTSKAIEYAEALSVMVTRLHSGARTMLAGMCAARKNLNLALFEIATLNHIPVDFEANEGQIADLAKLIPSCFHFNEFDASIQDDTVMKLAWSLSDINIMTSIMRRSIESNTLGNLVHVTKTFAETEAATANERKRRLLFMLCGLDPDNVKGFVQRVVIDNVSKDKAAALIKAGTPYIVVNTGQDKFEFWTLKMYWDSKTKEQQAFLDILSFLFASVLDAGLPYDDDPVRLMVQGIQKEVCGLFYAPGAGLAGYAERLRVLQLSLLNEEEANFITVFHVYYQPIYDSMISSNIHDLSKPYPVDYTSAEALDISQAVTDLAERLKTWDECFSHEYSKLLSTPNISINTSKRSEVVDLILVPVVNGIKRPHIHHNIENLTHGEAIALKVCLSRQVNSFVSGTSKAEKMFPFFQGTSSAATSLLSTNLIISLQSQDDLLFSALPRALAMFCVNNGAPASQTISEIAASKSFESSQNDLYGSVCVQRFSYMFHKMQDRGKTKDAVEKEEKDDQYYVDGVSHADWAMLSDFIDFSYVQDNLFSAQNNLSPVLTEGFIRGNSQCFQAALRGVYGEGKGLKTKIYNMLKEGKHPHIIKLVDSFNKAYLGDGVVLNGYQTLAAQPLHFPAGNLFYAYHGDAAHPDLNPSHIHEGIRFFSVNSTSSRAHQYSEDSKQRPKLCVSNICFDLGLPKDGYRVYMEVRETHPVNLFWEGAIMLRKDLGNPYLIDLIAKGSSAFFAKGAASFHTPLVMHRRNPKEEPHPRAPRVDSSGHPWIAIQPLWKPKESKRQVKRDERNNRSVDSSLFAASPLLTLQQQLDNPNWQPYFWRPEHGENMKRFEAELKKELEIQVSKAPHIDFNKDSFNVLGADIGDLSSLSGTLRNGDKIRTKPNKDVKRRNNNISNLQSEWDLKVNEDDRVHNLDCAVVELENELASMRYAIAEWQSGKLVDLLNGGAPYSAEEIEYWEHLLLEVKETVRHTRAVVKESVNQDRLEYQTGNQDMLENARNKLLKNAGVGCGENFGVFVPRGYLEEIEYERGKLKKPVESVHRVFKILCLC